MSALAEVSVGLCGGMGIIMSGYTMPTYIALLRGINVSGHKVIRM
jgi:hypothetical protein